MIKQAVIIGILAVLIAFLLGACASATGDSVSSPEAAQSGSTVPGEKMEDDRFSPGPMGSGNMHW